MQKASELESRNLQKHSFQRVAFICECGVILKSQKKKIIFEIKETKINKQTNKNNKEERVKSKEQKENHYTCTTVMCLCLSVVDPLVLGQVTEAGHNYICGLKNLISIRVLQISEYHF